MYKLKSIARRSSLLSITAAFAASAILPAAMAAASELTPLTERSLLLSSSAPGYVDTDGSGYSTAAPNPAAGGNTPATFAPAGSGPNGMKTGQTFSFRLSSADTIEGLSFQYCTTAAGNCQAPGDNTGDARGTETDPGPPKVYDGVSTREDNATAHPNERSDLDFVGTFAPAGSGSTLAPGQFQVFAGSTPTSLSAVDTTDWVFESDNLEDTAHSGALTGKNNYVTISNDGSGSATGVTGLSAGDYVKVVFQASETVHITNPGSGHFFVKINTYSDGGMANMKGMHNEADEGQHNVIDGGVTVANVMTDSIHITTKVLETMAFSVGIQNPDTLEVVAPATHGTCEAIDQYSTITGLDNNRLQLGDSDAEYSLDTQKGHDVFSYWRLSSNSSGGATVYYSGNTLANTVGDKIAPAIDSGTSGAVASQPGTEQFGLGFVDITHVTHGDTLSASFQAAVADANTNHKTPTSYPFITWAGQELVTTPDDFTALAAQPISADYRNAAGTLDDGNGGAGTAQFKFVEASQTVPEPIAQQSETVISCATAKMRYVGNIAADTPAGVYTTKINYLAAPQY